MALAPSSPAVNEGGGTATSDQRGNVRPVAYPGVVNSSAPGANGADIGAFELQLPSPPPPPLPPASPPSAAASGELRVRVKCPPRAGVGGCKLALQAVSGKPVLGKSKKGKARKPHAESAVAKLHLAASHTALVTLKPKPKFAARLAGARQVLVRETETIKGATRTSYRKLGVVH